MRVQCTPTLRLCTGVEWSRLCPPHADSRWGLFVGWRNKHIVSRRQEKPCRGMTLVISQFSPQKIQFMEGLSGMLVFLPLMVLQL